MPQAIKVGKGSAGLDKPRYAKPGDHWKSWGKKMPQGTPGPGRTDQKRGEPAGLFFQELTG